MTSSLILLKKWGINLACFFFCFFLGPLCPYLRKWRTHQRRYDGSGVPASFLGFGISVTKFVMWKEEDKVGSWRLDDWLFLQYKIKQVAHSAPRMLINSHGCLGFHSLCSFWLSPQPSPRARVSTPSLSVFSSFSGGFYPVSPCQLL